MDEICARCGKELSWFQRQKLWNRRQLKQGFVHPIDGKRTECPEYKGKKLCVSCVTELACGTKDKYRFIRPEAIQKFSQHRQSVTYDLFINGALTNKSELTDGVCEIAEQYGYKLTSQSQTTPTFLSAGTSTLSLIFEKVVTTANETKFVNCAHCTTRYDANQYFKCPKCGAPN